MIKMSKFMCYWPLRTGALLLTLGYMLFVVYRLSNYADLMKMISRADPATRDLDKMYSVTVTHLVETSSQLLLMVVLFYGIVSKSAKIVFLPMCYGWSTVITSFMVTIRVFVMYFSYPISDKHNPYHGMSVLEHAKALAILTFHVYYVIVVHNFSEELRRRQYMTDNTRATVTSGPEPDHITFIL